MSTIETQAHPLSAVASSGHLVSPSLTLLGDCVLPQSWPPAASIREHLPLTMLVLQGFVECLCAQEFGPFGFFPGSL